MENRGRRPRRRYQSRQRTTAGFGTKSCIVTAGVVCLAVSMLQYNCKNCQAKQELMKLTSSVEDIAKQLNTIQNNYQFIEEKLAACSQELPKIEKQLSALGALAQIVEANRVGWNPWVHTVLPYVDVNLNYKPRLATTNVTTGKSSTITIKKPSSHSNFKVKKGGNETIPVNKI